MGFAARCAELRRFVAKNWRTVEETVENLHRAFRPLSARDPGPRRHGLLLCRKKIEAYLSPPKLFVESFFVACLFSGDLQIAHVVQ
jgi:hypothetical protein